jgi:D-3-phosphoglycerate dehydrogenase
VDTRHMFDAEAFSKMKQGVRITNESRAEVVDDDAMIAAIDCGRVARYVTDFPNSKLIGVPNVICLPHLGACTPESEEKCAIMAAEEIYDYIVNGNIRNSVNMPNAYLERMGKSRLCILHHNVPKMLTNFLKLIGAKNINVEHMINKSRGELAYTIVDLGGDVSPKMEKEIRDMGDVLRVRVLQ